MKKKKFGILGLGISGISAVTFLIKNQHKCVIWDDYEDARRNCIKQLKHHHKVSESIIAKPDDERWKQIDYLILSPGIPLYFPDPHQLIKLITKFNNIKIICDLELFYLYNPNNIYICITGTNGKSTTASLIHHILKDNGVTSHLVGNIGKPILDHTVSQDDILVVEASSYQLDLIDSMRFNIALILNITEDHLDRHGSMENYISAKCRIFKNQQNDDKAILGIDTPITKQIFRDLHSSSQNKESIIGISSKDLTSAITSAENMVYIKDNTINNTHSGEQCNFPHNTTLRGLHNLENIAAAYSAVYLLHKLSPQQICRSIGTYHGLAHRMQSIGESGNIEFINDSKATNAESTEKALEYFDNIYWIVGGKPKAGGINSLSHLFGKIKCAFTIGESARSYEELFEKHGVNYKYSGTIDIALQNSVDLAKNFADNDNIHSKKVILLSPACASFDQFKNFEERGNEFIKLSQKYIGRE